MNKTCVNTDRAPAPIGPYSQAVVCGGFVFCSGQIALEPGTGVLVERDIESEAARVMENLKWVLESSGSSLERVVKTTIFLRDMRDFPRVNGVYGSYFTASPPARATVEVSGLPKGARVEIECIAER